MLKENSCLLEVWVPLGLEFNLQWRKIMENIWGRGPTQPGAKLLVCWLTN